MATLNLKDELNQKEEEFRFSDAPFGMTLLTNPGYISSARDIMFTSHLKQFVNLVNPDFPRVFTNYENVVGKNSTGYYEAENNYEIIDIVPRFGDGIHDKHLYLMFIYDKKNDTYDVITKRCVEDLTEKFGYEYDNTVIDKKKVGDRIKKGEILYKTTSYDDDMNYCFGKNGKVMYSMDNRTIEDAIICSRSFAESMISKEIETVKVSLNDNDILCNLYGDNEVYRCFPDIGENVKHKVVCAKRRIHNSQILYDLKRTNLRKINMMSDSPFYNEGRLVDIHIYSNKTIDELEDNAFNAQIREYLIMQNEFYTNTFERCQEIIESGSNYTPDIAFYFKKAKDILDPNCLWREENGNVFSNLVIEFTFERNSPLSIGGKCTGRYGNKGVISHICEDDEMPYLATGERIDLILNPLGVPNRLNPMQLYETSINFICDCVRKHIKTIEKIEIKEQIVFDIINRFNEKECSGAKEYYNSLSESEKKEFFEDIDMHGMFINIPPLWETEPLFDKLRKIYADYDWIKPVDVYINKWGRSIKILKPMIVGDLYIIKLKQNSKKNFSARSTGALSKKGVPEKSYKSKIHQDLYSNTPIRIGEQENINSIIGVAPEDIAKLHMYYRSSGIGRQALSEQLATSTKAIKKFKERPNIINRNAEILNAYLKALGLRIVFLDEQYKIDINIDDIKTYDLDKGIFIGSLQEYKDRLIKDKVNNKYENNACFIGSKEDFDNIIESEIATEILKRDKYYIEINID